MLSGSFASHVQRQLLDVVRFPLGVTGPSHISWWIAAHDRSLGCVTDPSYHDGVASASATKLEMS
jgi:hypothetical protein